MLISNLTQLTDLRRRCLCDCGQPARYALPVQVRLSGYRSNFSKRPYRVILHLCGRCLMIELAGRKQCPAKGDLIDE